MRILFTRFPLESAFGGAEVQTVSLMKGLREHGHEVAFLGSCPVLLKEASTLGFPTTTLHIGPPPVTMWGAISFTWRRLRMKRELLSRLTAQRYDAVCMLSMTEKLLATEALSENGTRVFWIEHDRIGRWLRRNPWLSTLRRAACFATTITVSGLSRSMMIGLGWEEGKTVAIPNGVAVERFGNVQKTARGRAPYHVGCVARLTEDKGVDVLIDAVTDLPESTLTIIGRGREEGFLRKVIEERTLGERVHIIGNTEDLGAFYASLDVLVLPSRDHDPFGLVAAEAMAVGVPVIVTNACGIAASLQNGEDALIVRAGSSKALLQALETMFHDAQARESIARKGREKAQSDFTVKRMVDQYESLMRK